MTTSASSVSIPMPPDTPQNSSITTPRSTVAASLESLQRLASQPLTPPVRDSLARLIRTLRSIQSAVRYEQLPREKLRDLYDEACSEAGTLRFEISMAYKDSPELRDKLITNVAQCHDLLKAMHRALCDRLSVTVALESLRDLKDAVMSMSIGCRDSFLALCERVIEIFHNMLRQVPGYTILKQLHDSAMDALFSLRQMLLGETGLAEGVRKRFMYRIDLATEYLHAVRDRLIKSQSLSLALDTLGDIERNAEALYLVGHDRIEALYRQNTQNMELSGYGKIIHGADSKDRESLVAESTKSMQSELLRQKVLFVHTGIATTRAQIKDFQQEMLIVNDQNIEKLHEKYEDCFFSLQELSQAEFLDFPDALLPEQVALLRKKITLVGEYLHETASRNHLNSTFFMTSVRYMQSLCSLRRAVGMLSEATKNSFLAGIISPVYDRVSSGVAKVGGTVGYYLGVLQSTLARILQLERIKGLLPLQYVADLFRQAWDDANNLRIAVQNGLLAGCGKVQDGCVAAGTAVRDCALSAVGSTTALTTAAKEKLVAMLTRVCNLILYAQKELFDLVYTLSLDAALTADKYLGVIRLTECLARRADGLTFNLGSGLLKKSDALITGGRLRDWLENAILDYQIRGGETAIVPTKRDETNKGSNESSEGGAGSTSTKVEEEHTSTMFWQPTMRTTRGGSEKV